MLRLLAVLTAASLLWVCAPAGAQSTPNRPGCSLNVQITDEDGTALPKAYVLIHGEHGMNQPVALDRNGKSKIKLHYGLYNLFVSAMGFVPQARIVDLRTCKPLDVNLMLTIDSEHSQDEGF